MLAATIALLLSAPTEASPATWVEANRHAVLSEYVDLLAIPNVATDLADIRRNAEHISAMMAKRGLAPRLLESEDGKVPPLIFGE
ncbi:MAG TPA: hypothetical protein VFF61_11520, partial [Microvirga sp.]|nr:hypothetical protein [Microvirga sp.]